MLEWWWWVVRAVAGKALAVHLEIPTPLRRCIPAGDITDHLEQIREIGAAWAGMGEVPKLEAVEFIATCLWETCGFDSCPAVIVENITLKGDTYAVDGSLPPCEEYLGGYDRWSDRILINKGYLNDFAGTLETVAHEIQHAFQWEHVKRRRARQTCYPEAGQWDVEFRKSKSPLQDYPGYASRSMEQDAERYASWVVRRVGG